jgi:hypothetical protein
MMRLGEIQALDRQFYMNTFGDRLPVCFARGEGCRFTTPRATHIAISSPASR